MYIPTYRQALAHACRAVWHNKILWILGLLSVFIGHLGISNFIGYLFGVVKQGGGVFIIPGTLAWPSGWAAQLQLLWLVLILFILAAGVIFLAVTSQGALIAYVAEWYKYGRASVSKAWRKGVKHFWRIFFVNLIQKILLVLLLLSFGYSFFNFLYGSSSFAPYALGIVIALILCAGLILEVVTIFSLGYVVIENKKILDAISRGSLLFWRHLLVSLEVSVIILLADVVLLPVLSVSFFVSFIPSLIIWIVAGFTNWVPLMGVGFLVGMIIWLILIVFIGALFNAFVTSAWTYLFMKMHREGIASRIIHWTARLFHRN